MLLLYSSTIRLGRAGGVVDLDRVLGCLLFQGIVSPSHRLLIFPALAQLVNEVRHVSPIALSHHVLFHELVHLGMRLYMGWDGRSGQGLFLLLSFALLGHRFTAFCTWGCFFLFFFLLRGIGGQLGGSLKRWERFRLQG